jgi:hypothetical protein
MVTTKHICDICNEDSFKTHEEAEKHEKLPIIEGDYEGKVCEKDVWWYGFIIKDDSISKNMHERNYSIMMVEKSNIDEANAYISRESGVNITRMKYYIKRNNVKSIYGDELKKVNDFFNRLVEHNPDKGLPKPKSEQGYESI